MSNDASTNLQRARELRNHGRYADVVSELEELIRTLGPDLKLAVELGETLFIQGYVGRSVEVLDKHLANHDAQDNLTAAAGQIICCFSRFFATSQFKGSLRHADTVYDRFILGQHCEIVSDDTVRIENYYCKLYHLAARCGSFDCSHILEKVLPRLTRAFHIFSQRDDFFNALSVARTYSACCSGLDANSLLEYLASHDRIPALYRAHAQFSLASTMKSNEPREKQDRLYALALESYKAAGHAHGVLDTEIAMMCRAPLAPDDSTFGQRLTNLFKSYEALDYPIGLGSALQQVLNLTHDLNDFDTGSLVLNDLETLFCASTSKLTWLMVRVSTLARWSIRGGDRANVIQGGEALWKDLIESDCVLLRGQAAQLVSQAYSALKDRDMVVIWSERAQKDLPQTNLTAIPSLTMGFDLNNIEDLSKCYEMIVSLINSKMSKYSPEDAADQIEVFLNQALTHPNRETRSWDIIDSAIKLFEENLTRITDARAVPLRLATLRQAQGTICTMKAASRQDIDLELAALKPLKEARDLFVKEKQLGNAVIVLQREALLNVGIAQKFERVGDPQAKLAWQTAVDQYKVALDSASGIGLTFLACDNAYWVAFCEFRQWSRGWCSPETLLESLLLAECFVDRQRQEVSILRGMRAAVAKGRLSSDEHVRNIYRFAIQVCNRVGNVLGAWSWAQKSKARSLSDLLGLGVFIPLELMERIQENEMSRRLFEDERRLAGDLAAAPDTEQFKIRIKLENHQKTMREQQVLAELLNLREGVPITLNELFSATKYHARNQRHRTVVFVDWIATQFGLYMYVVKHGQEPALRELPTTIETIQTWVSEHLNSGSDAASHSDHETALSGVKEEDEAEEGPLRDLDVLVAPLTELSSPDDLLVLCPTGILHALPLHALRVGRSEERQILTERNPITYCASLTSLVQCCRRADSAITVDVRKRFLAVYERESGDEDDDENFHNEERHQVYASTKRLADDLNEQSLCGEAVTLQTFKETLEYADFIHFHGHCDYDPDLIADQSLRISSVGGSRGSAPASVAVKDLFDFRIKASHISLLACSSAVQRFQAGDDPLGLVTAFLSAGASSVLGTLWPVQSRTARLFSEYFYRYLLQSGLEEYGVYDLAFATREAILDVMQLWELRHPYHWASFVLHGAWFFKGNPP